MYGFAGEIAEADLQLVSGGIRLERTILRVYDFEKTDSGQSCLQALVRLGALIILSMSQSFIYTEVFVRLCR